MTFKNKLVFRKKGNFEKIKESKGRERGRSSKVDRHESQSGRPAVELVSW